MFTILYKYVLLLTSYFMKTINLLSSLSYSDWIGFCQKQLNFSIKLKLTKPVITTKPKINLSNLKTSNTEKVLRSKNCLLNYNDNQNFQDISYFQSVNLKATTGGVLKKAVLKNFAIFTKKTICVRVSFATFLRTPKLKNICRLLWISSWTKNLLITQQSKSPPPYTHTHTH